MLLPLVFNVAPKAFVDAIDARLAGTQMHVVDWWADDLDGDKTPEAIAVVCGNEAGYYLVQRGKDLLEAAMEIDGRNNCPAENRPAWQTRKDGVIDETVNVHHGSIHYAHAIRDGKIVTIRERSEGFDVNRDGSHTDEEDITDYDKLTWSRKVTPGSSASGLLVIATDGAHKRVTTVVGGTTLVATKSGDRVTLHVHADRDVTVRQCPSPSDPCQSSKVSAGGDTDVAVDSFEFEVRAGGKVFALHVDQIDAGYRVPTKW
jgi:hypothetical protein